MFNKKISTIALSITMGLVTSCGSESSSTSAIIEATEDSVKANYVAMAYASYSDSLTTAQALKSAIDSFIAFTLFETVYIIFK